MTPFVVVFERAFKKVQTKLFRNSSNHPAPKKTYLLLFSRNKNKSLNKLNSEKLQRTWINKSNKRPISKLFWNNFFWRRKNSFSVLKRNEVGEKRDISIPGKRRKKGETGDVQVLVEKSFGRKINLSTKVLKTTPDFSGLHRSKRKCFQDNLFEWGVQSF